MKSLTKTEQEKENKLRTIAEVKYKIDLDNIDVYLPKGKEFYSKV